ncbi:MAG: thioesterase [Acidobacteria bacterium]|nr:MAG: thioesterase [Acidobacteriota bacterium]
MQQFEKAMEIRWADLDQNGHVRHSAYYDYGAQVRIHFLARSGLTGKKMKELKVGPVLFKEECTFIKELSPNDSIRVNIKKGGVPGAKWVFHHEIINQRGEKCAHIKVQGAWLDLESRKLTVPPEGTFEAINQLPLGEDYTYQKQSRGETKTS